MKTKRLMLTWMALAAAGCMLTGCAEETAESSTSAETTASETVAETTTATTETTAATTADPDSLLKTIGTQSEDENGFAVRLTNATGEEITGVSIKESAEKDYGENLLAENDAFAADETRMLYYTAAENDGAEYTVQLTLSGDAVVELHQFPFGDLEEGTVQLEDGVAYLVYSSLQSKTEVSTKDAEVSLKMELEDAAAEKAAEEAAAEEAAAQAAEQQRTEEEDAAAEKAAEKAAEESAAAEKAAEEAAAQENANPDDGCLGDEGLFY